jgi:hypothetical protein
MHKGCVLQARGRMCLLKHQCLWALYRRVNRMIQQRVPPAPPSPLRQTANLSNPNKLMLAVQPFTQK